MKQFFKIPAVALALLIATTGIVLTAQPAMAEEPAATQQAAAPASDNPVTALQEDTVEVTNPYGLDALWKAGDFVARGTLLILVIMSIGSWYVIATKFYEQFKLGRQAKAANATFWSSGELNQAVGTLEQGSAYHYLAKSGLEATERHGGLLDRIDFNTWVSQSIQRAIDNIQSRLQDGLAFLGTVGSTAPFVGLFGTVWGIYHALTAIGIAGQASIDKVAGPVGESLIMTAIGLGVAVPAVLGYNWLVRRNKGALDQVRAFGSDLHAVLLGGAVEKNPSAQAAEKAKNDGSIKIVAAAKAG